MTIYKSRPGFAADSTVFTFNSVAGARFGTLGNSPFKAVKLPSGTSDERPAGVQGQLRFNTENREFEGFTGTKWCPIEWDTPGVSSKLWAWGRGTNGILGDGTTVNKCSPVREVSNSTGWCNVASSCFFSSAIKNDGSLWAWGNGAKGRLGDGTTVNKCSPVREVSNSTDWCQVSAGFDHGAAIKTSGQIWSWGCNLCGQLGDGTTVDKCSPVREVSNSTDWCRVSAGGLHTTAIKTSGQIWSWGCNLCGQLGDGTAVNKCSPVRERCSATNWCQVSSGRLHTSAVKTSGQLWSWGCNGSGDLGDGTTVDKFSPVREVSNSTDWCQVSAGGYHTTAIKDSGQLWAWGRNTVRQLGDGTQMNRCSPVREFCSATDWYIVSAGGLHTTAIKTSRQLWGWGFNTCGNLGDGTTVSKSSPVREITSSFNWVDVSASASTLAIVCSNKNL
jgi:alpha-tubulin suppressor-like RCC1 family protein